MSRETLSDDACAIIDALSGTDSGEPSYRTPVGMMGYNTVICDDGSVWQRIQNDVDDLDDMRFEWHEREMFPPIPGTKRAQELG